MKTVTLTRDTIERMSPKHENTVTLFENLNVKIGDTVQIKLQDGAISGTARVSGFGRRIEGNDTVYYYSFNSLRVAI